MSGSAAHNFASFATYAPPPDEVLTASSSSRAPQRPWFPAHVSSGGQPEASYQSGGLPDFGSAYSSGVSFAPTSGSVETGGNQWQTRFGWRVDMMAATAYILGPITALLLLILETVNDYVRFHAYQSALLTTPLLLATLILALFGVPKWFLIILTTCLFLGAWYTAYRGYHDAVDGGMIRFKLPLVGNLADRWVAEE